MGIRDNACKTLLVLIVWLCPQSAKTGHSAWEGFPLDCRVLLGSGPLASGQVVGARGVPSISGPVRMMARNAFLRGCGGKTIQPLL